MNYWWVRTRSNGSGPAASAPVILKGGQLIGRSLRLGRLALGSARRIPH
jgi:hypothetical protein